MGLSEVERKELAIAKPGMANIAFLDEVEKKLGVVYKIAFTRVIVDEAQGMKNPNTLSEWLPNKGCRNPVDHEYR
jgi:hypothetical protein